MEMLELSRQVGEALSQAGYRICAAESCSGGLLLSVLTDVAGSSAYVQGGLVTYSDVAKVRQLGVRPETLLQDGAVSKAVAGEMAQGALRAFDTDFALSVTGVLGPEGGYYNRPIGTIYVGLAQRGGMSIVEEHFLQGDRMQSKHLCVRAALNLLLRVINAQESPPRPAP